MGRIGRKQAVVSDALGPRRHVRNSPEVDRRQVVVNLDWAHSSLLRPAYRPVTGITERVLSSMWIVAQGCQWVRSMCRSWMIRASANALSEDRS